MPYNDLPPDTTLIYRLLAHLYLHEVDQELLSHLHESHFPFNCEPSCSTGFALMTEYLRQSQLDPLTELAADFAKLFLGVGTENSDCCVYPYESVHTASNGLIMQEARDEVIAIFRSSGLDVKASLNLPEDHLGLELEFLAHLSEQATHMLATQDHITALPVVRAKLAFIERHLLNWLPVFCRNVRISADTVFYKGLALITESFIRSDLTRTRELVRRLNDNRKSV